MDTTQTELPKFRRREGTHVAINGRDTYYLVRTPVRSWKLMGPEGYRAREVKTIQAANDVLAFDLLAINYLTQVGATQEENHRWSLETLYGTLRISIYEDWVAMRFEDVAQARGKFRPCELNYHSGKWNLEWYRTDVPLDRFQQFYNRLESVLCAKVAG